MFTVRKSSLLALAFGFGLLILPTMGHALTFTQSSDDCSNLCGTSSSNVITVTDNGGGTFDIQVQLATGWQFMGNNNPTVEFALAGIGTLNFGAVTLNNNPPNTATTNNSFWTNAWAPTGFSGTGGATTFSATGATFASNQNPNPLGPDAYGMNWGNGNGQSKADGNFIDFTINNAGLTLAAFETAGFKFFVDVYGFTSGNTGNIDFSLSSVPLPPAALLFGTALVGMGILGRRRRRKDGLAQA
jgi:hypothetical protein